MGDTKRTPCLQHPPQPCQSHPCEYVLFWVPPCNGVVNEQWKLAKVSEVCLKSAKPWSGCLAGVSHPLEKEVEGSCREEGALLWRVGNKGLKLQREDKLLLAVMPTRSEHHLHPRGAEKPPTNPAGAELVLPWCWAGALAAAAPPLPSQVTSSHVLPCPTPPRLFGC